MKIIVGLFVDDKEQTSNYCYLQVIIIQTQTIQPANVLSLN